MVLIIRMNLLESRMEKTAMLFDPEILDDMLAEVEENGNQQPVILTPYADEERRQERAYLESVFQRLPEGKDKKDLKRDFLSERNGQHHGAWGELVLYDWLTKPGKDPVFKPKVIGKTPDFLITERGQQIYLELASLQDHDAEMFRSPMKVINKNGEEFPIWKWYPEETDTYNAVGNSIDAKLSQYREIGEMGHAYVVCVLLRNWNIDLPEIKKQFSSRLVWEHGPNDREPACSHVSGLLVARAYWSHGANCYHIDCALLRNGHADNPTPGAVFENCRTLTVRGE